MGIQDVLALIGGLAMFLFGMNVMGNSLEKLAGGKLKSVLASMTSNRIKGFLLGMGVTAVIQSSSATTVMVVGFVNSGLMTLSQSIGVIMGANIGTTITAWILSLSGISDGAGAFLELLKPSTFTPVLALIGIALTMFCKTQKKKDLGTILLGFAVLMFGMSQMSDAVTCLKDAKWFGELFLMFENPILGVLAGAVLTAIIQSSSASVGILQALSTTGKVTYGASIPIIMGQGIGTCVTAVISSFGTNKNAKRAAMIHLSFNVIGTVIFLTVYSIIDLIVSPAIFDQSTNYLGISICNTAFKVGCAVILLPCARLLEKLSYKLVPDGKNKSEIELLDIRLLEAPSIAIEQCRNVAVTMAKTSVNSFKSAVSCLSNFDSSIPDKVRADEDTVDEYEDELGSYLVKISSIEISPNESAEVNKLLHIIGDYERISDHAVNIIESAEEIKAKNLDFSDKAKSELNSILGAVNEILDLALEAFDKTDIEVALKIEPLEQVVDDLKDIVKRNHIERLTKGECTIELGFILSDIITNLERVSDHCSNVGCCLIEATSKNVGVHEYIRDLKLHKTEAFEKYYSEFKNKYAV